jgi:elongator complex protein 3
MNRGHTVTDSINATRIAKESGMKVCYHMMPGLLGSDNKKDVEAFLTIFEDPSFKPDMIKIYPTLTIQGTKLYDMWKKDEYEPLDTESASKLVANLKNIVPEWVRIQRIQRDVPSQFIDAGVDKSNLRQYVEKEMQKDNRKCRCIRCREIGHKSLRQEIKIDEENISLNSSFYDASGGEEVFISLVEDNSDSLIGYLRLRNIVKSHRVELTKNPCTIIRELKIVGRELSLGKRTKNGLQHKGFGKELIDEAERITIEVFDKKNLFVLSGVGVKEYYRRLNFIDNGVYLSKTII